VVGRRLEGFALVDHLAKGGVAIHDGGAILGCGT
ncbi:MAG: hypothetical protein RLZ21_975, partial [Pseudomonadota bacterium]